MTFNQLFFSVCTQGRAAPCFHCTWTSSRYDDGSVMFDNDFQTYNSNSIGISLWDCIVSNVLSLQSNHHVDLLTSYHSLTLPVHSVYVFLLSAVLLSLLDRCNLEQS